MANAILGLWAQTSLHAGASASSGVIDLPIQREAHTGWPCVFGSGVKGALRTAADDKVARDAHALQQSDEATLEHANTSWVNEVFGPPMGDRSNGASYAGALSVGDARLLLLPVRSLTTHFKWVTCQSLLERAIADCERLNVPVVQELPGVVAGLSAANVAIYHKKPTSENTPQNAKARAGNKGVNTGQQPKPAKLFLEELSFTKNGRDLSLVIEFLAQFMKTEGAKDLLTKQLAVVSNDVFAHLAQFATPVTAHIAIDSAHKRVIDGALWYEETLPPETVLYVALQAQSSRKQNSEKMAQEVLSHVQDELLGDKPYFQLGGNETVGMGWCKVAFLSTLMQEAR